MRWFVYVVYRRFGVQYGLCKRYLAGMFDFCLIVLVCAVAVRA